MNKRLTILLLATVLFLGSGILSVDAAAPKAKKPVATATKPPKKVEDWSAADWKKFGKDLASLPAVKKMSSLERAKYITDQLGQKYEDDDIKPNTSYFGKGRSGLFGNKAPGTCGDLTVNIRAALEGAGFATGEIVVEKKGVASVSGGPFDVNRQHGAPIVMIDGKEWVFDLWYHSGMSGKLSGFASATDSGAMAKKDWIGLSDNDGYKVLADVPAIWLPGMPLGPVGKKLIDMGATEKEAKAALDGDSKDVRKLRKRLKKQAKAEQEKKDKIEAAAKAEQEKAELEKKEAAAKAEQEKIEKAKAEQEKIEAAAKAEQEKAELEKKEAAAKAEQEKIEKAKAEQEKIEAAAKAEQEKIEKAKAELEKAEKEKAAKAKQEKIEKAKAEQEKLEKAEQEKIKAAAKAEQEMKEQIQKEREAAREPGGVRDNRDGSTTTTKGYVENKDGRITVEETRNPDGSVTTTHTKTDRDGNVISETTYGESGEGKTTRPNNDLRDAEPKSDAEVDVDTASNGANTSSSYGDRLTEEQQQRSADGSSTMAQNTQMDEASNVGNQQTRDARTARDSGGREAGMTADAAARNTAKSDRENSWGKAVGDGVEAGVTKGATAMGSAFGSGAADVAIGAIFGPSKEDEDSSGGGDGKSVAQGGPSGATSGGGSTKGKKKPKSDARGGGRGGGGSEGGGEGSGSGGEDGNILISTSDDIPMGDESIDGPDRGSSGSSSSSGSVMHCPKCGRTDMEEVIYRNIWHADSHVWECPYCGVEAVPGPPPAGLGEDSGSTSVALPDDEEIAAPAETPIFRDQSLVCPQCGHYPMNKDLNADIDDSFWWVSCPKCGWKKALR